MDPKGDGLLKVGELARRSGVSVRTLHYYDEIGLVSPGRHSAGGHRLYGPPDVARLQQVVSLRELGFSLDEIRACLGGDGPSVLETVETHLARVTDAIAVQQQLAQRLQSLAQHLRTAERTSVGVLADTLQAIATVERYYTSEQRDSLRQRAQEVGESRLHEVETEWANLVADVRHEMEGGTDPRSETMAALAVKWRGLIEEFTGDDPGIKSALKSMYQNERQLPAQMGLDLDGELMVYVQRAMDALQGGVDGA